MSPPTANRPLSQWQMILVSMFRASSGSLRKVAYEELVLQTWRDFPEAFSLRNHPEYPDASDIHKRLSDPLKREGHVLFLGNKTFRLTDKGLEAARNLLETSAAPLIPPTSQALRLARSEKLFIEHALSTRAFSTWRSGRPEQLVDYDAKQFFQFSTGTKLDRRQQKVEFARQAIRKAIEAGIEVGSELELLAEFLISSNPELLMEA